jgi:hypothetical protein
LTCHRAFTDKVPGVARGKNLDGQRMLSFGVCRQVLRKMAGRSVRLRIPVLRRKLTIDIAARPHRVARALRDRSVKMRSRKVSGRWMTTQRFERKLDDTRMRSRRGG